MAEREPQKTRQICPEILSRDSNGEPIMTCGIVHMSAISPTCPEHIQAAAAAFWRVFDGGPIPDTSPAPAQLPTPTRARRKKGRKR